jgi:hypothetical protein
VTIYVIASLAALAGMWAGVRGVRRLTQALRGADDPRAPLELIRGIRGIVVAVAVGALASGLVFGQKCLLVFGAIFLTEELYETGVVALVLRADRLEAASIRARPVEERNGRCGSPGDTHAARGASSDGRRGGG